MLTGILLATALTFVQGKTKAYSAWLETPGGELRFGLELVTQGKRTRAFLVNGEERIEIPRVELTADEILLEMPHYDSRIRAKAPQPESGDLVGTWEKRRSAEEVAQLPFHAQLLPASLGSDSPPPSGPIRWSHALDGRWAVHFADEKAPAVAVFKQRGGGLTGTFLTTTGDYRYLAGSGKLVTYARPGYCPLFSRIDFTLSCFDGAHAFLFTGTLELQLNGQITGDFWSGNWHHETWTAKRDDAAELADPFAQTTWNGKTKLADLVFPDLDGQKHSLGEFAGPATLLVVLGSWCPNCNDEAKLLAELDAKYRARGLCILGLAFELTGEFARDAEQARIFQRRHGLEALPFFLCGTADKAEATKALGLVDRVRAFPTTIFVGADGLPKAIHSGYAGPATGEEHQKLRRDFEARLEALLAGK